MTDDLLPFGDADEDETRAAQALQRALDGGSAGPDLPDTALEAAALLRFSAEGGRLNEERRVRIREELLASLRAPAPARKGFGQRLAIWLPLFGAAALSITFFIRSFGGVSAPGTRDMARAPSDLAESTEPTAPKAAADEAAPRAAADEDGTAMLGELGESARHYRQRLLASLHHPELERAHAELDAAISRAEVSRSEVSRSEVSRSEGSRADLERSQRTLTNLATSISESEWSATETRLVRQDLFCRLAETALRIGEPRAALEWTRQGIDLDGPATPFLAQLVALEGQALSALGDRLEAAKSYMKALQINETLLDESLDGP